MPNSKIGGKNSNFCLNAQILSLTTNSDKIVFLEVKGSLSREQIAKEKAKRVRFLLSQGFNYEQVTYALDYDPLEDNDD